MTERTATITVSMDEEGHLATGGSNQGIPIDKLCHGMVFAIETMFLDKLAQRLDQTVTPEFRASFGPAIRAQTLGLVTAAPTLEQRTALTSTIDLSGDTAHDQG